MIIAMFSWAVYSALLRKKKYKISQITLLQVVIICGLIFLIPPPKEIGVELFICLNCLISLKKLDFRGIFKPTKT